MPVFPDTNQTHRWGPLQRRQRHKKVWKINSVTVVTLTWSGRRYHLLLHQLLNILCFASSAGNLYNPWKVLPSPSSSGLWCA